MGRKAYFKRSSQAEFAKDFLSLCQTKSSWRVWADFVAMSAISISNAVDRAGKTHDAREREYMSIFQSYKPHEQEAFPKLLSQTIIALDKDPEQDFLGELFMRLDMGNHWKGQYFSPYDIARLTVAIVLANKDRDIKDLGWTNVCDPCCGSGVFLIVARNEMKKRGYGSGQMLYVAQDIDRTAALMCYIQLSLLGCAGYVVVGNSITQPIVSPTGSPLLIAPTEGQEVWITPALYDPIWLERIRLEKLKCVEHALEEKNCQ